MATGKFIHLKCCNLYHNVENEGSGASNLDPQIEGDTRDRSPSSPTHVNSKRTWADEVDEVEVEDNMRAELAQLRKRQKEISAKLKKRKAEREGKEGTKKKKGNEILRELSLSIEHLLCSVPILQKRQLHKGGGMCL